MEEEGFLQTILQAPKDDTPLLVFADWLEERGDDTSAAKAEFLRLTVAPHDRTVAKGHRKARSKRLIELAAMLDTNWLAVVSRLSVESCQGKRAEAESQRSYRLTFEYLCDRRWEDLQTTDAKAVRFCDQCQHNVHYCDTISEAREHAWAGHCIAVDLGVMRRKDDLEPERHYMGMPSAATLRSEEERMRPDPVSAERERKKQSVRQTI